MRSRQRSLSVEAILKAVDSFEIIESYPGDKYLPSYLVRGIHASSVFHIQLATDVKGENVRIVTAYFPNPDEWDRDFRVRKE